MCVYMCVYIYVYICVYVYIYIYISENNNHTHMLFNAVYTDIMTERIFDLLKQCSQNINCYLLWNK